MRGLTGDLDDPSRQQALEDLRRTVEETETADGVLLASAAWLVTACR